jgi:hypothetical protein
MGTSYATSIAADQRMQQTADIEVPAVGPAASFVARYVAAYYRPAGRFVFEHPRIPQAIVRIVASGTGTGYDRYRFTAPALADLLEEVATGMYCHTGMPGATPAFFDSVVAQLSDSEIADINQCGGYVISRPTTIREAL